MSETLIEAPSTPKLTPRERVAQREPLLTEHGWTVHITATEQRARLEATHPSGAAVMVTSGQAGRASGSGNSRFYVLRPTDGPGVWLGVRLGGFEEFVRTLAVTKYKRRLDTKCQCRSGFGKSKTRYTTQMRAQKAMEEARRHRAREGETDGVECRTYRCPDDDRVWHTSSRPVWRKAPGGSQLWDEA
jgi:hypothetical protein